MTARKLHYKDISDTASTHLGRPGDIWFDPASTVLRTYNGSPGGKTLGGAGSITSSDVTTALGYTPLGSITSSDVTTALGYTPYNSINPSGYTNNTGTVTSVGGAGTVSGLSLSGSVTSSGSLTLGGTLTLTSGQVTTALGYTPVSGALQVFSSTLITISTTTTYNLSTAASYNILNVTVGGLTATLNMPTSPINGQLATIAVIKNTVTLAEGTGTVSPGFAGGWVLGTTFTYIYMSADSTWYRVA
jgi:hypothetical protein